MVRAKYSTTAARTLNAEVCKEKAIRLHLCRKGLECMKVRSTGPEPGCGGVLGMQGDTDVKNTTRLMEFGCLSEHCKEALTKYVTNGATVSWKRECWGVRGGGEQITKISNMADWSKLVDESAASCLHALKDNVAKCGNLLSDAPSFSGGVVINQLNACVHKDSPKKLNFKDLFFVAGAPPHRTPYQIQRRIVWEPLAMARAGVSE